MSYISRSNFIILFQLIIKIICYFEFFNYFERIPFAFSHLFKYGQILCLILLFNQDSTDQANFSKCKDANTLQVYFVSSEQSASLSYQNPQNSESNRSSTPPSDSSTRRALRQQLAEVEYYNSQLEIRVAQLQYILMEAQILIQGLRTNKLRGILTRRSLKLKRLRDHLTRKLEIDRVSPEDINEGE